jgi:4-hydroxybenzoate polyprenyltransferase
MVLLLLERLLFIGALAILFDLRDITADRKMGLKTIPNQIGERKSLLLSNSLLGFFLLVSFYYYNTTNFLYLFPSALISFLILLYLINSSKIKLNTFYHSFYLDGAILLHGLLIILFYFCHYI